MIIIAQSGAVVNIYEQPRDQQPRDQPRDRQQPRDQPRDRQQPRDKDALKDCQKHKTAALRVQRILADHYADDSPAKAARIRECSTWLTVRHWTSGDSKLLKANFCRHSLCPFCAWRKHARQSVLLAAIMRKVTGYQYHVVLTIPSVPVVDRAGIRNLIATAGRFLRAHYHTSDYMIRLEITHTAAGYHPHIHAVILLPVKEGTSPDAVAALRSAWGTAWSRDYCIAAIYQIDVVSRAAEELTKYITKYTPDMSASVINAIADATYNVHTLALAGVYRRLAKAAKTEMNADAAAETDRLNNMFGHIDTLYRWMAGTYEPIKDMEDIDDG